LVATTFGFWFGAQDKDKAQAQAEVAKKQLAEVVSVSTDPEILTKARKNNPQAFPESQQ
jgi:hypothetical protein